MGASSAEIDQEIRDTRSELDQTLGVLERRAASGARTYGRVAAGVAAGLVAVVVGVVVYRRRRQKNVARQLHRVLFESVRDLPEEVTSKLRKRLPIKIVITDRAEEDSAGNVWTGLAGKIGPSVVGSATGAVMSRLRRSPTDQAAAE